MYSWIQGSNLWWRYNNTDFLQWIVYRPVHVNLDIRKIDKLANSDIDPILIWRIQNFKYTISGKSLGTLYYYFLLFSITFIYPAPPPHIPPIAMLSCAGVDVVKMVTTWERCFCCCFLFFFKNLKIFYFIIMLSWGLSTTHQWEACQLLLSFIIEMNKTAWPPNEIIDIS